VTVNREEFQKLRERTRLSVTAKKDRQHFKQKQTEIKNNASRCPFYHEENLALEI
jgi:hypothetical protein